MLLLTLRGTPTTYYGEEIGMENVAIPPEFVQDPPAVNQPEVADIVGRDPVRTPMQWDSTPNAGFTPAGITPWLPLAPDYQQRDVAAQEADPGSDLNLYRSLSALRRAEPSLHAGQIETIDPGTGANSVLVYRRSADDAAAFLIVLNLGHDPHRLDLRHVAPTARIDLSTSPNRQGSVDLSDLAIAPDEGLILRLEP
jgi:alpha-glucosidase